MEVASTVRRGAVGIVPKDNWLVAFFCSRNQNTLSHEMRCRAADTPIPRDDPFQNDIPTQLTGQPVPTDFDRQQGVTKLFRRSLIASFALLVTACVPIPPESVIVATPTPERELDVMQCPGGRIDLFPGQSAHDPLQLHLPDYLDIVGVESSLDGETLTAILHLRNVPEELEFNRTGLDNSSVEYKWAVDINIDNAGAPRDFSHEYTLEAFHVVNRIPRNAPPTVQPFKEAVEIKLLKITYYPKEMNYQVVKCRPPMPAFWFHTNKIPSP